MLLKHFDSECGVEEVVSDAPTHADLANAVDGIDWLSEGIVGVILERDGSNWADGSGSLEEGTGLSLMLEDGGTQHVATRAPATPEDILVYLTAYLDGDMLRVFEILYDQPLTPQELAEIRGNDASMGRGAIVVALLVIVIALLALGRL